MIGAKTKYVAIAIGMLSGTLIVLLLILWWTLPRITPAAFDRIQMGMTKSEVATILNRTHHHAPGERTQIGLGGTMGTLRIETEGYVWISNDCQIYVEFDESERVAGKLLKTFSFDESYFERICRRLRLS